jgi:hypothetical protein
VIGADDGGKSDGSARPSFDFEVRGSAPRHLQVDLVPEKS